mmetsp:Transcript_8976/g.8715  ORF Transcript_8976/g.8715 Transcript_8976/m.8715 type:complete len:278 (-) Transcript_8976:162-995(-)
MFTQQIILLTILCQVGVGFSLLSSASSFFSSPSSTSSIRNAYSTSTSTSTSLAYAFDTKEKTVTSTEEIIHEMTTGTGTAVLEGVPVITTTEDDDSWATTTQYYDVDAIIDGIDDAYSTLDIINFDDIDVDVDNESTTTRSSTMQQEQDRIRESIQESIENDMEDEIAMLHRVNAQPDLIDQETGRVTLIPTLLRRSVPLTESTSPLLFFTEEELHTAIVKRTMRKLAQRRTSSTTATQVQAAPQTHTSIVVSIQKSPTTNLEALQAEFKRVTASHK